MLARVVRQNNLKINSLIYEPNIDNKKIFIIDEKFCLLNYLKIYYGLIIIIRLENWHMNMLYLIKK